MSDTTGDDVERITLDDLSFEEAVEVVKEVFGLGEMMARTYVAISRGEQGEGVIQEEDDDLT